MRLKKHLEKIKVPEWIKKGKVWEERGTVRVGIEDWVPIFDLETEGIKSLDDLERIFEIIEYWKIPSPYPCKIWEFLFKDFSLEMRRDMMGILPHYFKNFYLNYPHLEGFAAEKGEIEVLKFFKMKNHSFSQECCKKAAANGHFECLKLLHEYGCFWNEETCNFAVKGDHLECLIYIHENSSFCNERTCATAAEWGALSCLTYLRENDVPWDIRTSIKAAENGELECLTYVIENGCPFNDNTMAFAAEFSHLDCVKYLTEKNCPVSSYVFVQAASFGNLATLQFLHEAYGDEYWSPDVCEHAAESGNFETLKYAREHGCPWNELTALSAAYNDRYECFSYALENDCPFNFEECKSVIFQSFSKRKGEMVALLKKHSKA